MWKNVQIEEKKRNSIEIQHGALDILKPKFAFGGAGADPFGELGLPKVRRN